MQDYQLRFIDLALSRDALRFGVTTMLDQFSDHRQLADAKHERASFDATDRADLWSAGTLATAAGGHGTQFGIEIPTLATPADAAAWVAAMRFSAITVKTSPGTPATCICSGSCWIRRSRCSGSDRDMILASNGSKHYSIHHID